MRLDKPTFVLFFKKLTLPSFPANPSSPSRREILVAFGLAAAAVGLKLSPVKKEGKTNQREFVMFMTDKRHQ